MGIGQLVVNLPCQREPVGAVSVFVGKPGDDDTGGRPHTAIGIATVPDVPRVVLFVRGTVEFVPVAKLVQPGGAEPAADIDAAKCCVQRFQQIGAQPATGGDGKVRVVRNIRNTVDRGDFAEPESRRKNESDRRARPRLSRPLTEAGVFTVDRPGGRWRRPSP